jgi:hypothetical protein
MTIISKQKFALIAPAIAAPFLVMIFVVLGGGEGVMTRFAGNSFGLNTELPGVMANRKAAVPNKMASYLRADQDSARKREVEQRDPYHRMFLAAKMGDSSRRDSVGLRSPGLWPDRVDGKAKGLLQQLERLRASIRQPAGEAGVRTAPREMMRGIPGEGVRSLPVQTTSLPLRLAAGGADTGLGDPQLERLNSLLDKVIRIQHPAAGHVAPAADVKTDVVIAADSASNSMAAEIPVGQTLVSGSTLPLRLTEDVVIHGKVVPRGQWMYGIVSVSQDRMLVHIRSVRVGLNIYPVDLQVYDLDGLPGIHIPGMLGREVAKESADEGIGGLNLVDYNSSLGASAAEAGIQAAKTLLRRKVRLVRVSVRAGYQVLLRDAHAVSSVTAPKTGSDSVSISHMDKVYQPPGFVPGGSFLRRCREEGMELGLQGIWLKDSLLWFALSWRNGSAIGYNPDYCRWFVRDRRQFKRTAEQDLELEAVQRPPLTVIPGDSSLSQWTAFRPFAIGKDKELVVEVGERNGGRAMELVIGHKHLLNAKRAP